MVVNLPHTTLIFDYLANFFNAPGQAPLELLRIVPYPPGMFTPPAEYQHFMELKTEPELAYDAVIPVIYFYPIYSSATRLYTYESFASMSRRVASYCAELRMEKADTSANYFKPIIIQFGCNVSASAETTNEPLANVIHTYIGRGGTLPDWCKYF